MLVSVHCGWWVDDVGDARRIPLVVLGIQSVGPRADTGQQLPVSTGTRRYPGGPRHSRVGGHGPKGSQLGARWRSSALPDTTRGRPVPAGVGAFLVCVLSGANHAQTSRGWVVEVR